MNSSTDTAPHPAPSEAALWRIKLTCNVDGKIMRTPHEAKIILPQLGMNYIQDLLPANHGELVSASINNRKPRLVYTANDSAVFSLEYSPGVNGIINVIITGQPNRDIYPNHDSINQGELQEILDHLTAGVILFNENLRIFYTNRSAQRLLASGTCLNNYHGYLACANPEITAELKTIAVDQKDHLLSIDRGPDRSSLHVMVTLLKSGNNNVGRDMPTSILFAFATTDNYARIEEVVRSLYRLSPSEAKLVSQLFVTPHLPTAADALGITLNTARTHLKRIYVKTRVNRIASLIHMIVTGPASIILNTDS